MLTKWIRTLCLASPVIGRLLAERDKARTDLEEMRRQLSWGPGHFYLPIPSAEDVARVEHTNSVDSTSLVGINVSLDTQVQWLQTVQRHYADMPFGEDKILNLRYYFNNTAFVYGDGVTLYAMLRELKPRRIVEVGSGFSSAVMLDVNERFFEDSMRLTFIEPFPEVRLLGLMRPNDHQSCTVIRKNIQDISEQPWQELQENDILFIDSSHVSKCGSDVNLLFFEILPKLAPGVVVHVHDVFANFEYPVAWLKRGWFWNEAYLLRAFLQFNEEFEILFWPSSLLQSHSADIKKMPMFAKNPGSSFWMRRRPS
jgi:hypothetical protein